MHKKLLLVLLCFILTLAGCAAGGNPTAEVESTPVVLNESVIDDIKTRGYLIVGCKMDVPELSFYDNEADEWSGLEVELAYKTAAKIFGVDADTAKSSGYVKLVGVTVADREEKLESGEVDCIMATYTITDERAKRFAFSDSYFTDYIGLMVKSQVEDSNSLGSDAIKSIADLDGKYIGVPRNATTRDAFLKYIDTMNTVKVTPIFCEYEGYEVLFEALKNGNIDVMAVDVSILNGYVDNTTTILSPRFGGQHYGAAVNRENALLLDCINEAINE